MPTVIDVGSLGSRGFRVQGSGPYDRAGSDVTGLGDVNGDGIGDISINAPGGLIMEAFVIYGRTTELADINLASFTAANGFSINGHMTWTNVGYEVAGAGDVNSDGFDDITVLGGGYLGKFEYNFYLQTYVIYGGPTRTGTLNVVNNLTPSDGFSIGGPDAREVEVAGAGDINGDGFSDVIVRATPGKAMVIFGKESGFGAIGEVLSNDWHATISDVSGAGDFNGDGFDDFVVTTSGSVPNFSNARPAAYLIFGRADGFGTMDLASLASSEAITIAGQLNADGNQFTVAQAGDMNGDGLNDVIIAAAHDNFGNPAAYVIFGTANPVGPIDLTVPLSPSVGFAIFGNGTPDLTGLTVAGARRQPRRFRRPDRRRPI